MPCRLLVVASSTALKLEAAVELAAAVAHDVKAPDGAPQLGRSGLGAVAHALALLEQAAVDEHLDWPHTRGATLWTDTVYEW